MLMGSWTSGCVVGAGNEEGEAERLGGEREDGAGRERKAEVERGEPIRGSVIEALLPILEMFTIRWPGARVLCC